MSERTTDLKERGQQLWTWSQTKTEEQFDIFGREFFHFFSLDLDEKAGAAFLSYQQLVSLA